MNWIIDNWTFLVVIVAAVILAAAFLYKYTSMPQEEQLKSIKEWLLQAVLAAESAYGGKTGKLKLSTVYDEFCKTFPWLAKIVPVELFSQLVDEVLTEMEKLLNSNEAIKTLVDEKVIEL